MKILSVREEDIDDACQFVLENEFGDHRAMDLCAEDLKLVGVTVIPPGDLIDLGIFGPTSSPGWILALPEKEWLDAIESESSRKAEHLLQCYRETGGVSPAITVEGYFGDGRLRSFFAHALGVDVPVAHYTIASKRKRALFQKLLKNRE